MANSADGTGIEQRPVTQNISASAVPNGKANIGSLTRRCKSCGRCPDDKSTSFDICPTCAFAEFVIARDAASAAWTRYLEAGGK
jgi:hypothetical protein